jgi:flagellar basal-body rod modification protein FlgD
MSDISLMMSTAEKSMASLYNAGVNKENFGKADAEFLGKEDFLKILITQMSHQDPTNPTSDKESIAQMAQFSSLEQMKNMASGFQKLSETLKANEALSFLGKTVEAVDGDHVVVGKVEEIKGREIPLLMVNGRYYDVSQVQKVRE